MCWLKYHSHNHIKEIQSGIKQSTQLKSGIMNMWIRRQPNYFQESMHLCAQKDMQSWIVLLCLFTLEHTLLDMWSYRMWQQH